MTGTYSSLLLTDHDLTHSVAVSLPVYGLDLWPHGIYKLSLWNDSESWFKLLKSSSYTHTHTHTHTYIYIYVYIKLLFFYCGAATQRGSWPPHSWSFLDHKQRRTTGGRTSLDEWSARRRDLYLTTHNTHNRQTSMPSVGFEPTISAGERPQAYALDRAATGTGKKKYLSILILISVQLDAACK